MQRITTSRPTRGRIVGFVVGCLLWTGCGPPPVREDRHVNWSKDGAAVSFQHGAQGVFVADPKTGQPLRIFDVDEATIAVSSPLWSPTDQRLLFTTARRRIDNRSPQDQASHPNPLTDWAIQPDGVTFRPAPVTYTCWLRPAPVSGDHPQPVSLFEAECDHPGYVGANLAVRWHPDGQRILFVAHDAASGQLELFAFDLASRTKSRVAELPVCDALLFDWSPDQSRLAVLCVRQSVTNETGIWLGDRSLEQPWWHVPGTESLGKGTANDLERLRGLLPAWTADGQRFLIVAPRQVPASDKITWTISLVDAARQSVRTVLDADEPIRALKWHPDGSVFGLLRDTPNPVLELRNVDDVEKVVARVPDVQRFVGWDVTGNRLAYVAPDAADRLEQAQWPLLLIADPDARHRVFVADGGADDARSVFDKMHITFPQWSPTEPRLSLWATFSPTYRSILSWLGTRWSVRPGDPAFVLDMQTGNYEWMAVDAHEKAQVGHYYQLHRDFEQAWKWYEEARRERATQPLNETPAEAWRQWAHQQDPTFFEYICLTKLGRTDEAATRLSEFRQRPHERRWLLDSLSRSATAPTATDAPMPTDAPPPTDAPTPADAKWLGPTSPAVSFLQDLYIEEAFLSLDMLDDGIAFLQSDMAAASASAERLAHASVLSQLLLIRGDQAEYAKLLTDTWAPAMLEIKPIFPDDFSSAAEADGQFSQIAYIGFGGAVLIPLFHPDFIADLPDRSVDDLFRAWTAHREQAKDNVERFAIDLVLHTAATRLKREDDRALIAARILGNPAAASMGCSDIEQFLTQLTQGVRQLHPVRGHAANPTMP